MNVKSIVVEHLYWEGSIKTLQLSPNFKHEMWVAFPDEYEEPLNAPFHFQDPDDEKVYNANYAKCKARKLSKERFIEEEGVYIFKNSWQGIPTERGGFSFYTLYLPENAIPVQIDIIDPYNTEKQFNRTVYKDEVKKCYVIYLQCSSKYGAFSFDMKCVFKKDEEEFKDSYYTDRYNKDFHQKPELWRDFLDDDNCKKTESFFAQSITINKTENGTIINTTGDNNKITYNNTNPDEGKKSIWKKAKKVILIVAPICTILVFLFGNNIIGRYQKLEEKETTGKTAPLTIAKDTILQQNLPYLENLPILDNNLYVKYYFNNFLIGGANADKISINGRTRKGEKIDIVSEKDFLKMNISDEPYLELCYNGIYYSLDITGQHHTFNFIIIKDITPALTLKSFSDF